MISFRIEYLLPIGLALVFFLETSSVSGQGSTAYLQLESTALKGNSIGDSPKRSVSVYLPPSYQESSHAYPVLYFLHGFTDSNEKWFGMDEHWIDLPAIMDEAMQDGSEFIVVMPNAHNTFFGSMYTNSSTTGLWEDFIAGDLVTFIDSTFRTIPEARYRGLAGHSMGGYGTAKIGMKNADVFSSLYLMSPCCLENSIPDNPGLIKNLAKVNTIEQIADQPFFVKASLAAAAAWAPNPDRPPLYLDLPSEGSVDSSLHARFAAHAIVSNVHQYREQLTGMGGIVIDVGKQDFMIRLGSEALHQELEELQIPHRYHLYEGDHTNKIGERLGSHVVPFFQHIFSQAK
ncbi:MAG: hypothetical protein KTR24_14845 [Saprospiraceae bacterium]|nr:hypothetical protein [Saprospiraceae bacterium]